MAEIFSCLMDKQVTMNKEPIIPVPFSKISPLCRHKIRSDGNCLFRAISKFSLGSELGHKDVRSASVKFMQLLENSPEFEHLFGFGGSIGNYIKQSIINLTSTYGTDKEIIVYATMIQSNVLVYSYT